MPFVQTNLDKESFKALKILAIKDNKGIGDFVHDILINVINSTTTQEENKDV